LRDELAPIPSLLDQNPLRKTVIHQHLIELAGRTCTMIHALPFINNPLLDLTEPLQVVFVLELAHLRALPLLEEILLALLLNILSVDSQFLAGFNGGGRVRIHLDKV